MVRLFSYFLSSFQHGQLVILPRKTIGENSSLKFKVKVLLILHEDYKMASALLMNTVLCNYRGWGGILDLVNTA